MSAAVMGSSYSPSPSSPLLETSSPIYPDRPIRPLPKRRLRSRLSDDVAESILYPTTAQTNTPLFYFPYNYANDSSPNGIVSGQHDYGEDEYRMLNELDGEHAHGRILGDSDGDEECTCQSRAYHEEGLENSRDVIASSNRSYPKLDVSRLPKSHPALSSASSIDGYDSFENTNNKKKRKIPTSGMGLGSQSHLSADMANMGISSRDSSLGGLDDPSSQHYAAGSSIISPPGTGISGAGRGRFGRSVGRMTNPKVPLAVSSDGLNSGRSGALRKSREWMAGGMSMEGNDSSVQTEPGIISAAIAASGSIQPGLNGQENVSLLQQQAARKASPTKTQFTFTSTDVQWPGAAPGMGHHPASASMTPNGYRPPQNNINRNSITSGTQTSPDTRTPHHASNAPGGQNAQNTARHQDQPRKPRRSASKEYRLAASQRKLKQEAINYRNPPRQEDIYVCMFCEYTDIFGTPPLALIRQYEEKDRRDRLRVQEKRRLLEKAKEQAKKGKKGGKSARKASNTAAAHAQQNHHQSTDQSSQPQQGAQSEEHFDDLDDEPRPQPVEHEESHQPAYSGHTMQGSDSHLHQHQHQHQHHHVESGVKGGGRAIPARA